LVKAGPPEVVVAAGDTQEHDIVVRYDLPEVVVVTADTIWLKVTHLRL
jgi:hypothetical protein